MWKMGKWLIPIVFIVAGIGYFSSLCWGEEKTQGQSGDIEATAAPQAESAPQIDPEAEQILRKCEEVYAKTDSWQVKYLAKVVSKPAEEEPLTWSMTYTMAMETVAKKPNNLSLFMKGYMPFGMPLNRTIVSDGTDLYVYFPGQGEAIKRPSPATLAQATDLLGLSTPWLTSELNLSAGMDVSPYLDRLTKVGEEVINGRSANVLDISYNERAWLPMGGGVKEEAGGVEESIPKEFKDRFKGMKLSERLWIDAEDFLIRQTQIKMIMPTRKMPTSPAQEGEGSSAPVPGSIETTILLTSTDFVLNPEIPDSKFVFVPTKGVKIVNESELMRSSGGIDLTGKAAQDFALPDLQGNQVSLSQFKGKVVVLDFWATWCPPCRKEMPELQTLFEKYKDKDVQVIAVSTDDTTEPVEAFVKDNSISFLVLHGSRDEMRAIDQFYKITAIPRVLIIDREGVIKADITGYEEGRIGKELEKLTQ